MSDATPVATGRFDELPWWVDDGGRLTGLPIGAPECIAAFPAGSAWAWAVGTSVPTVVLHSVDAERYAVLHGWSAMLRRVAVHPRGVRVAGVDRSGALVVHDLARGHPSRLDLHPGSDADVWRLAWSPDGLDLLVLMRGRLVVVAAAPAASDGRPILTEVVPATPALDAAWLPDSRLLVVGLDAVVTAWSFTEQKLQSETVPVAGASVVSTPGGATVFNPDGELHAIDEDLRVTPLGHIRDADHLVGWSPDGQGLAAQRSDGRVAVLWPRAATDGVARERVYAGTSAAWDSGPGRLALGRRTGLVEVHDLEAGTVSALGGHTAAVRAVATRRTDGAIGIAGIADPPVRWGRPGSTGPLVEVPTGAETVRALAWRPPDRWLGREPNGPTWISDDAGIESSAALPGRRMEVSASGRWAAVHDPTSQHVRLLKLDGGGSPEPIVLDGSHPAFSPTSARLAMVRPEGTIAVFAQGHREPVETRTNLKVTSLAWGAGDAGLTIGSSDGIHLLDHGRWTLPPTFRGPTRLAWNPAGRLLAALDEGGILVKRLHSRAEPTVIRPRYVTYDITWIDDETLASGHAGGVVQVWRVPERTFQTPQHVGALISWAALPVTAEGDAQDEEDEVAPAARRDGTTLRDRPDPDVDLLDAHSIALGLDGLIRHNLTAQSEEDVDRSVAVNLDGAWGRGKSTVLTQLQRLDDPPRPDVAPWLVVHHDAWRHSQTSPHWWALARDLHEAVAAQLSRWGRTRLGAADLGHRFTTGAGWPALLACAIGVAAIALVLRLTDLVVAADGFSAVNALLASIGVVAATVTLVAGLGRSVRRFATWTHGAGADALAQAERTPLAQAAAHIHWLRQQALRTGRPILFVIDELDRCPAETVVQVLDSVHTLGRPDTHAVRRPGQAVAPIAFLVLADGAWIRHAYQTVHADQVDALPGTVTLGAQFHAKLFNLVVPLPPVTPTQHRRYATHILDRLPGGAAEARPRSEAAPDPLVQGLDQAAEATAPVADPPPDGDDRLDDDPSDAPLEARTVPVEEVVVETSPERVAERQRHVLEDYAALLPRNPRALKRVVNDWTVQVVVRGPLPPWECLSDDHMIRWVILAQSWPDLAERLLTVPDLDAPEGLGAADVVAHLGDELTVTLRTSAVRRVWPLLVDGEASEELDAELIVSVAKLAGQYPPAP